MNPPIVTEAVYRMGFEGKVWALQVTRLFCRYRFESDVYAHRAVAKC